MYFQGFQPGPLFRRGYAARLRATLRRLNPRSRGVAGGTFPKALKTGRFVQAVRKYTPAVAPRQTGRTILPYRQFRRAHRACRCHGGVPRQYRVNPRPTCTQRMPLASRWFIQSSSLSADVGDVSAPMLRRMISSAHGPRSSVAATASSGTQIA